MKINKQIKKDIKAVKRALNVFKDEKRIGAVKKVIIENINNKNVNININF